MNEHECYESNQIHTDKVAYWAWHQGLGCIMWENNKYRIESSRGAYTFVHTVIDEVHSNDDTICSGPIRNYIEFITNFYPLSRSCPLGHFNLLYGPSSFNLNSTDETNSTEARNRIVDYLSHTHDTTDIITIPIYSFCWKYRHVLWNLNGLFINQQSLQFQ